MNIHKINKLLQVLSSHEVKQFGRTLKDKTILERLFNYLKNPKKKVDDIDKMIRYVLGAQVCTKSKKDLHSKASDLYKLLQKWLIQQELEADELTRNKLLAKAFKRYQITDDYLKTLYNTSDILTAQKLPEMWHHLEGLRLTHQQYFHSTNDFGSTEATENFAKIKYHFDEFCGLAQSAYLMEEHTRHTIFKSPKTWSESEKYIIDNSQNPLTHLYNLLLKINQNTDSELYKNNFLSLFEKHIDNLHPEDRATLITLQLNYTVTRTRAGDADFTKECYKAYRMALDKGYLEYNSPLHSGHFLNAMVMAATVKAFEWCEQLIRNAPDRLEGEVENIVRLGEAFLHFYKKDIKKTRQLLDEIAFENINYRLRVRSLNAQCYYELFRTDENNDGEDLIKDLNAYEQFIGREKKHIGNAVREANINFIYLLKKVVNHPHDTQKILTNTLRNTEKRLIAKIWLWTLVKR